jgi:AraC-like DNA-binding protein
MDLKFDERLSDSPFVERIWRTHSESATSFISMALSNWQMCIWTENGKTNLTVRGPETKATRVPRPANTEFLGIVFKIGTFMPFLPGSHLVDADCTLPDASSRSVWLNGAAWEFPDYENADTFVEQLVREGMLRCDSVVEAALQDQPQEISLRSVQRRFSHTTGLTHGAVSQIERARYAVTLLKQGLSILDTVDQAGYADQPHLTRSLKYFTGQTPLQIIHKPEPLSYLFTPAGF